MVRQVEENDSTSLAVWCKGAADNVPLAMPFSFFLLILLHIILRVRPSPSFALPLLLSHYLPTSPTLVSLSFALPSPVSHYLPHLPRGKQ